MFYLRFIDDVFGIWLSSPNYVADNRQWNNFQDDVNDFHGLPWEFIPRSTTVQFMDLTVSIEGERLSTDLFEKPMALYLYIPPHSTHPPGGINGLITGQMLRIFTLCSDPERIKVHTLNFLHRLEARGYDKKDLIPLLDRAAKNARKYLQRSDEQKQQISKERKDSMARCIRLHRLFNPYDPSGSTIQLLFRECILTPEGRTPLYELENLDHSKIPIDRLMLCNHRAPNLGNFLSYRDIEKRSGAKVSAYLKQK